VLSGGVILHSLAILARDALYVYGVLWNFSLYILRFPCSYEILLSRLACVGINKVRGCLLALGSDWRHGRWKRRSEERKARPYSARASYYSLRFQNSMYKDIGDEVGEGNNLVCMFFWADLVGENVIRRNEQNVLFHF